MTKEARPFHKLTSPLLNAKQLARKSFIDSIDVSSRVLPLVQTFLFVVEEWL